MTSHFHASGSNPTDAALARGLPRGLEFAGRIGAVLLGAVVGSQAMIAALLLIHREADPALAALLTNQGRVFYRPEYDLPIYLSGCLLSLILSCGLTWIMIRAMSRLDPARAQALLASGTSRHFLLAAAATLAFLFAVRTVPEPPDPRPLYRAALLVGPGALALSIALLGLFNGQRRTRLTAIPGQTFPGRQISFNTPSSHQGKSSRDRSGRVASNVFALIVSLGLVSIVAVTSCSTVAGLLVGDMAPFHHWDFFVMGPTLRYLHGGALGTEVYSQYGVVWPVFFAWLAPIIPISYANALAVFISLGALYFVELFLVLRWFLGRTAWAAAGVLVAINIQMFLGAVTQYCIWVTPSSSVLRSPMDVTFFLALFLHQRSGRGGWATLAGIFTGLGLLFETDTGIYLLATLVFYLACQWRWWPEPSDTRSRMGGGATALSSIAAALFTTLLGLAVASRGTLFRREFWAGWLEALPLYGGGMSSMPFAATEASLFLAMVVTYLIQLALLLTYLPEKRVDKSLLLGGCLAAYGLCMLLLFINRSHFVYLYHACVPFCVIWTAWLALGERTLSRRTESRRLGTFALGLAFAALAANPSFLVYPHVWNRLIFGERPKGLTLTRNVTGLSPNRQGFVDEFQEVTRLMSALRHRDQSVGVLDPCETLYYLGSVTPPHGRYTSPVMQCIRRDQVAREGERLASLHLDYWIVRVRVPARKDTDWKDVLRALASRLTRDYDHVATIDSFDVFRSRQSSARAHR